MTVPGELNISPRLLLGPGPGDVHPRVLTAMATPLVGHLDPQFLAIMNDTQEMLRQTFGTTNHLTLPISATGMAGMECCLVNLLEPGDKIVVCCAGYFGQRLIEVAGRTGATVTELHQPWGQVFDLDMIRQALQTVRPHRTRRDVHRRLAAARRCRQAVPRVRRAAAGRCGHFAGLRAPEGR